LDLNSGRSRVADWNRSHVVAIYGHGATWSVAQEYANNHAAWIEAEAQGSDEIQVPEPSLVRVDQPPSVARIVDRGRAVAFGGATEDGLWLMKRDGAITAISKVRVLALATDGRGDRLVVVTPSSIALWQQTGPNAWMLRWSHHDSYSNLVRAFEYGGVNKPTAVVALSHDGALLAATDGKSARTITVYDAATGAPIAALTVGDQDRFVTALAIGSAGAIYAGTNTGRVLALSLRR
jgi:outer membrane protein assembly factor BamB